MEEFEYDKELDLIRQSRQAFCNMYFFFFQL